MRRTIALCATATHRDRRKSRDRVLVRARAREARAVGSAPPLKPRGTLAKYSAAEERERGLCHDGERSRSHGALVRIFTQAGRVGGGVSAPLLTRHSELVFAGALPLRAESRAAVGLPRGRPDYDGFASLVLPHDARRKPAPSAEYAAVRADEANFAPRAWAVDDELVISTHCAANAARYPFGAAAAVSPEDSRSPGAKGSGPRPSSRAPLLRQCHARLGVIRPGARRVRWRSDVVCS